MKKGLVLAAAFCAALVALPAFAGHIVVPARGPAVIIAPDYSDPYLSPSEAEGRTFLSDEGYVFTYDSLRRRMYQMPYSYAVQRNGRIVPVESLGKRTVPATVLIDGMFYTK